ncbi:MAG: hypothetical protein LBB88_11055 [Planctomycetaceae bacterium]|jgi:hypothetical protein|nr:hypothetical protein [Planctomycetaceae bacterium]
MAEGRDQHAWSIASTMMALIANCHRDSKQKTLTADDFNPTLTKDERKQNAILITDENVHIMRDEFLKIYGG